MSQFAGFFRVQYNFSLTNYIKCPLFILGYNSNIIGELGDFIKFYGKIPDIFVLITGHFGLFKTPILRLGEAGTTQTQSQTWRLNISKTNFKSVRKTILIIAIIQHIFEFQRFAQIYTGFFRDKKWTKSHFSSRLSQSG